MRVRIRHRLTYNYEAPVFLEPYELRLRPRESARQRLIDFELTVDPLPAGRSDVLDAAGNAVSVVWFNEPTARLEIRMNATVETLEVNPFEYLITPVEAAVLPARYPDRDVTLLAPYRDRPSPSAAVDRLAAGVSDEAGPDVVSVLGALSVAVQDRVESSLRPTGAAWSPAETLAAGRGACRDAAVLLVDACRSLGLAARFVSGYALGGQPDAAHQMHAWTEIYLPGAGWRGYDPTLGLSTADRHVAVAAAPEADGAAITVGTYRGDVGSTFDFEVDIE